MTKVVDAEQRQLAAVTRLGAFAGRRVLEVGCGEGRFTRELARHVRTIHASDPTPTRSPRPAPSCRRTSPIASPSPSPAPPSSTSHPAASTFVFFSWSL
jgi:hypothetical protein